MTLKEFSVKYNIPLAQVKAAMGCERFMRNDQANREYYEEQIRSETFRYMFMDVIACMDRIAEIAQKESKEGAK